MGLPSANNGNALYGPFGEIDGEGLQRVCYQTSGVRHLS